MTPAPSKTARMIVYSTFAWEGANEAWEFQITIVPRRAKITPWRTYVSAAAARAAGNKLCRELGLELVDLPRVAGRASAR